MKQYHFGDVLVAEFSFPSGAGSKVRPAVVILDAGDDDVLCAILTSQLRSTVYDISITQWKAAKLELPSVVRMHKMFTIRKSRVIKKLGRIQNTDLNQLKLVFHSLI